MQPWMLDLAITILILGITYALTSEGLWGAALTFFNVLFSALIALNFYELLAKLIVEKASGMASFADILCLGGLFVVSLIILKVATEKIAPSWVAFPSIVENLGRLVFGLAAATLTVAFLLLVANTAPVHQKIFGLLDSTTQPPWNMGIDHKLLGFFKYTSGYIFPDYSGEVDDPEYGKAKVFDRNDTWLTDHQNARPFTNDTEVPAAPEGGAVPEGAPPPGGAMPPGMPPPGAAHSPRIPGSPAIGLVLQA